MNNALDDLSKGVAKALDTVPELLGLIDGF